MINFYDLPFGGRTLLTTFLFLALVGGICLMATAYFKRYRVPKMLISVVAVLNAFIMILYAASLRSMRQNYPHSPLAEGFCQLPVLIPILLLLLTFAYYLLVIFRELAYRKTTITRSSIKEGIDKVSSGLCFYYESGRIILMNNRMNELCHSILGRDLQNANLFWQLLQDGETATRLTAGENPTFRLNDDSVWLFAHQIIDGVHQLTASDITQLQTATDELTEENKKLTAFNQRLKQYGENVDELTRTKERLEIKVRIHRELGQALLASRRFLLEENAMQPAPLDRWKQIIALLHQEAKPQEDESPMVKLHRAAKATGIRLEITGELPADNAAQLMFVQAAAEALTNAISHAGAKTLYLHFLHDVYDYIAQFTNDGIQPTCDIVEGGGLSSLRRKIEREGGSMMVDAFPEFTLTVTLPMKGDDAI